MATSSNPAFSNSPAFSSRADVAKRLNTPPVPQAELTAEQLTELYSRPSATPAETDRMSYQDVLFKVLGSFVILLVGAAVGWIFPVLMIPALVVGLVLALVNVFKKKPNPALVLSYAAVEGVAIGALTMFFETRWPGIAMQAVIGTFAVVGVTLALFASGKVRASAKATKVFLIAMVGYGVYSLVNLVLMWTGTTEGTFGLNSIEVFGIPVGVIIGLLVVVMGAYSLVLDFDAIKTGVQRGAPRIYGWAAAFGIVLTVVWLYLEILRILALLRGSN